MTGCSVVGIGNTAFTRRSGRSVASQAVEAVRAAPADAGLTAADVDGVVPVGGNVFSEDLFAGLGLADDLADALPRSKSGYQATRPSNTGTGALCARSTLGGHTGPLGCIDTPVLSRARRRSSG